MIIYHHFRRPVPLRRLASNFQCNSGDATDTMVPVSITAQMLIPWQVTITVINREESIRRTVGSLVSSSSVETILTLIRSFSWVSRPPSRQSFFLSRSPSPRLLSCDPSLLSSLRSSRRHSPLSSCGSFCPPSGLGRNGFFFLSFLFLASQ